MRLYKYILIIIALATTTVVTGQNKYCYYHNLAIKSYQDADFSKAKELIDSAINMCPSLKEDAYVWHVRGFICKDLYFKTEKSDVNSPSRELAIESFVKSFELDDKGEYIENNKKAIKKLAGTYSNNAAGLLDTNNYAKAITLYGKYKSTIKIIAPNTDFTTKDINFNNVLAAVYKEQYENNRTLNREYLEKSIETYSKTLAMDSMNFNANYNLGVIYYNIGVGYILSIDDFIDDLEQLIESQEKMTEYCKKALPYLKRAAKIKETREIIEGFRGIYKNLNEQDKMLFYEKKLNEYDKGSGNE